MADLLKRLARLVKETGDKIVLYDSSAPEEAVVLVSLDQYERFLTESERSQADLVKESQNIVEKKPISQDLTEEELTDIINRDVLNWKNEENSPYLTEECAPRNPWPVPIRKDRYQA